MAEIGSVLSGRYRLMELLAQGGMATIYRAHDLQLERDVAVKLLRPEYGRDPDFIARFRQEAQAAAGLNDPGVVAVFDFGQDDARDPYIVMELVDGQDLAAVLRANGPLPPRQAARIAASIARALAVAHAHGFVHRDVKPSNVLISREGRVKVVDFGIARAVAEAQVTLPGTTLGSVHYFSPEQARGEPTTPASDIYSLGIVLFEMLTGVRPWEGDSAASVAVARLSGPVPGPSDRRAGIPPTLDAIDRKALALDPDDRFHSASAMADALDSFLSEQPAVPAGAAAGAAGGAGAAVGAGAGAIGAGAIGAGAIGAAGAAAAGSRAAFAGGEGRGGPGHEDPDATAPAHVGASGPVASGVATPARTAGRPY
ncbi:MAG TPA: protein kinase, partial [Candidatus Dormibacteraeota bacterium]|nr:protein kinase [Candidatus Dormibacteraeota bacterium]